MLGESNRQSTFKVFSGICAGVTLVAGCAAGESVGASGSNPARVAAATAEAGRLRAILLPPPQGMRVVHGPETGFFGSLESTRKGLAAVRAASADRPECAKAAQLDATEPTVASAPAAVVAFASDKGSITEAIVSMPTPGFPAPLPKQCTSYTAAVNGTKVTYRTRELSMPRRGDQSRAYLTTAAGGGQDVQVGTVLVRRGKAVMSLLVVGHKVKREGLYELGRLADERLAKLHG